MNFLSIKIIEDKTTFSLKIGDYEPESNNLHIINIFIDIRNICINDNKVYIPQFVNDLTIADYLKKAIF